MVPTHSSDCISWCRRRRTHLVHVMAPKAPHTSCAHFFFLLERTQYERLSWQRQICGTHARCVAIRSEGNVSMPINEYDMQPLGGGALDLLLSSFCFVKYNEETRRLDLLSFEQSYL